MQILKFCICWQFWSRHLYVWLQTNWWRQSVTCFYHYSIGEYSTVHFSITLQSKFGMSATRIWLFVDNFGAWKMQFGSLKSAWILYFEFASNPVIKTTVYFAEIAIMFSVTASLPFILHCLLSSMLQTWWRCCVQTARCVFLLKRRRNATNRCFPRWYTHVCLPLVLGIRKLFYLPYA